MRRLMLRPRRDEKGVVVVLMAAFALGIVGLAALVVDVGAILDEKRQLQNGADAAALGLAQYIGQTCPTTATAACTSALQGKADELANANARDGFAKVEPPTANHATKQVTVSTSTLDSGSGTILPYAFGQILSGVNGRTVKATATASWAGLRTASVIRLTLSRCEFDMATVGGTVFDRQAVILFHGDSPDCTAGPSGSNLPGGFGWLDDDNDSNSGDCVVTSTAGATVGSDTGNSAPSPCHIANYLGDDILLALFDEVSVRGGSNGSYHIYGFGQFHLTGFRFPSGGQGGVSCPTNACVVGNFIRFVPIGDLGGPNVGNRVALVS